MDANPSHPSPWIPNERLGLAALTDLSRSHASAAAAVRHAISRLEMALTARRFSFRHGGRVFYELRRDLPYVIQDCAIPETQILVNREYKPLGSNLPAWSEWVRYEEYANLHVTLTPKQIAQVVCGAYPRALFGDPCPPWKGRKEAAAYLARLSGLLELLP